MVDPNLVRLAEAYSTALAKVAPSPGSMQEQGEEALPSDSDEDQPAPRPARMHGSSIPASALPGLYKKRRRPADGKSGAEASSSSSEEDEEPGRFVRADASNAGNGVGFQGMDGSAQHSGDGGSGRAKQKRRHALPGRIRKKLARQKGSDAG